MRRRTLAILGFVTLTACGGDSRPTPPLTPSPQPSTPPQVTTGVRIEGPASVAPGASAQYRLIASFQDGTTGDVTSQASWTTSNASVLAASQGGIVNGMSRGEAALNASYSGRSTHVYVLVLEDGTYRVTGRVVDSGLGLPGARVEVVAGTGTGLAAMTGSDGSYALYGLAGEVQIDAVRDGFARGSRRIVVQEHSTVDLELTPTTTPTDLNGEWRLTLSASSGCNPPIPADAAMRSYSATITQTGTRFLLEARFPAVSNIWPDVRLDGLVIDRSVTILVPTDDSYVPGYGFLLYSLGELLGPDRFLAIAGTAHGERVGAAVTGTLDGEFAVYLSGAAALRALQVSCQRDDHGFRLDRN